MDSDSLILSDLPKYKRKLSFYKNEFIQVCFGLNFEAKCFNSECKAARSMGGLVEIQYPGMMSCNYHEVVPSLKCPFCHNGLPPDRVKGIVFVRCKVLIGFGEETVEFRVKGEQTVLWELPCDGSEIQVILLHKDPEPQTVSELSLDGAHNRNTNLMHSTSNGFPDIVQSYRYIHQEQHVPPQQQHVPPQEQHVPPQEQHVPPQEQHVPPQEQHVPPQEQHVPPQEQHVPPQEQHVPPQGQHVPPQGQHVPPQEQHVPPQGQHVPPQEQHVPPQEQHVPPQEQHVPPQGQHVPPQEQHVPPKELFMPPMLDVDPSSEQDPPVSVDLSSQLDLMFAELIGNSIQPDTIPGLNLLAKCSYSACPSNAEGLRHICIGVGAADPIQYRHLIADRICPSCNQPIPLAAFRGILLLGCIAQLVKCGKEEILVSDQFPIGHCLGLDGPDVEITVLLNRDFGIPTGLLSQTSKASISQVASTEKSFTCACIGLNLEALCANPACNANFIVFPCPETTEADYSALIKGLICPGCRSCIPGANFIGLSFIRCKAEVRVGDKMHILTAEGNETADFKVDQEGPEVHIRILKREISSSHKLSVAHTAVSAGAALGTSGEAYTTVCNGVNFMCYCKDTSCQANRESDGQVIVKRDEQFIERNGCSADCCDYNAEIQCLLCPSCGNPLDRNNIDGVSLVRCKGTIESSGKCEPFVAAGNNLRRYESDELDATAQIVYKVNSTHAMGKLIKPERGLNLLFNCPNSSCPSRSIELLKGVVTTSVGVVADCNLQSIIQDTACPHCDHTIPSDNYIGTLFTECTARVKNAERTTSYIQGESTKPTHIDLKTDPVVDILPVQARQVSTEPFSSAYRRMKKGMNVKAICPKLVCASKEAGDGMVIISFQEMKGYSYQGLLNTVNCPFCHTSLSDMILLCLSFIQCRAELVIDRELFIIEAGSEEAIDYKPNSSASDVTIYLMEEELNCANIYPDNKREGFSSKGGGYSQNSVCHGLNFVACCPNSACDTVRRGCLSIIPSGHLIDCDLRPSMKWLVCPSCEASIQPNQVSGVLLLRCSGEITIHGKTEKFNPTDKKHSEFIIPKDTSPIIFKVTHRDYRIIEYPAICYIKNFYTKHGDGFNFHCYCTNPTCTSVREKHGFVVVQRDEDFVNDHGFEPSVCHYNREISHLKCSACGSSIKKYFVWGVGLLHCRGIITRHGSEKEFFTPDVGQVTEYQLDSGDTSLRIEFGYM